MLKIILPIMLKPENGQMAGDCYNTGLSGRFKQNLAA